MARTTKQLSGAGKDKFLKALVRGGGLPADAAERIGQVLSDAVTEARVRRDAWETISKDGTAETTAPATPAIEPPPPAPAFDPFVFSALALLTRQGKPALAAELDKIAAADDLRRLADAQHLPVEPGIADPPALRLAIIAATERRLAERRAAAS